MSSPLDLALLERYEPVLRFTRGEQFFPMGARAYVRACSLWAQQADRPAVRVVEEAQLTLDRLAQQTYDAPRTVYFLKLIDPLNLREMAAAKLSEEAEPFARGPGRLTRVGYVSRLADAAFRLGLLARGRVPGDTAAAAVQTYNELMGQAPAYCYHGRVVRQDQWLVLQYWFLYAYNNWRTRFSGANDHEADWEMVSVYLAERPDSDGVHTLDAFQPEWVAYASHDYSGDDLRRRWDDPELGKLGSHPVVYVGAGSHASYFSPGEYLTELALPFTAPLVRISGRVQTFWRNTLRQYTGEESTKDFDQYASIFRIPFVDYARGDGLSIGPGQACAWDTPVLLNPAPPWVTGYRGLWGLYTRDPFNGEDAPAGPMYNRDGSVRLAWYDPVAWAGLDKVVPFAEAEQTARRELDTVRTRQQEVRNLVADEERALASLGTRFAATRTQPHLQAMQATLQEEIETRTRALNTLRAEYTDNLALMDALRAYAQRLAAGERGPVRAHIKHAHQPAEPPHSRRTRFAEVWAAISVGLMLLVVIFLAYFLPGYLAGGLAAIIALFAFIEASIRGRLDQLITSVTFALTLIAALVLLYQFYWEIIVLVVLAAGVYILFDNLRELIR
ncbi:MAG: hypothetical protein R2851_05805 [Caldilineaceae bacterium]